MSHATEATEVGEVCGGMAQRKAVAAVLYMRSIIEHFVPRAPTARRAMGMPRRCGWSVMALRDSLQALLWAMPLGRWLLAMRSV